MKFQKGEKMFNPILWTLDCAINYQDFEKLCNELFLEEGFSELDPLGGNYDNGRDAQVKLYRDKRDYITFFQYSLEKDWEKKLGKELANIQKRSHKIDCYVFVTNQNVTGNKKDFWKQKVKNHYGWELTIHHREWLRTRLEKQYFWLAQKYLGIPKAESLYNQLTGEKENFEVTPKPIRNGIGEYIITKEKVRLRAYFPKFPRLSSHCIVEFASLKLRDCLFEFNQKEIMTRLFKGLHTNYRLGLRGFLPVYSPNSKNQFIQFRQSTVFVTEKEVEQLCQVIDEFSNDLLDAIGDLEKAMGTEQFMPSLRYKDGYRLVRIDRKLWGKALDFANSNSVEGINSQGQMFDWCDGLLKVYTETGNHNMDTGYHAIIYPEEAEYLSPNHRTANDFVWLVWRPMTSDIGFDVFEDFSYKKKWNASITYGWLIHEFLPNVIRYNNLRDGIHDIHRDDWRFDLDRIRKIEELKNCVSSMQQFYSLPSESVFLKANDQQLAYAAVSNSLNVASFDDIRYILSKLDIPHCLDTDQIVVNLRTLKDASKDSVVGSFAIDCVLRVILYACDNMQANLDEYSVSKIANCLKPYYEHYRQCKLLERYSSR